MYCCAHPLKLWHASLENAQIGLYRNSNYSFFVYSNLKRINCLYSRLGIWNLCENTQIGSREMVGFQILPGCKGLTPQKLHRYISCHRETGNTTQHFPALFIHMGRVSSQHELFLLSPSWLKFRGHC